jgi:hypothetical protein
MTTALRSTSAAALALALVVMAGCGGTTAKTVTAAPAATVTTAPTPARGKEAQAAEKRAAAAQGSKEAGREKAEKYEYPAALQHTIIAGCRAGDATESQCKCVVKKLEAHLTVAQLAAIERGMATNAPAPPGFTKYAEECKGQ